jgi:hypothetical protein
MAGKVKIVGDILEPAIPLEDWEFENAEPESSSTDEDTD